MRRLTTTAATLTVAAALTGGLVSAQAANLAGSTGSRVISCCVPT